MPGRPDRPGEKRAAREAEGTRRLRRQEAPPADLLAQCGGRAAHHAQRSQQEQRAAGDQPGRRGRPAEAVGHALEKRGVAELAHAAKPDDDVGRARVGNRQQVGDPDPAPAAPAPAQLGQRLAGQPARQQRGRARAPHQAGHVQAHAAADMAAADDQRVEHRAEGEGEQQEDADSRLRTIDRHDAGPRGCVGVDNVKAAPAASPVPGACRPA